MSDVAQFILERVAEDEATATIEGDGFDRGEQWHTIACGYDMREWPGEAECVCGLPARVLAECAAKRALISGTEYRMTFDDRDEFVLMPLARIWSAHPDFDPAWAAGVSDVR